MAHYQRLSLMEREELSRMLTAGDSLRATAEMLHRAPITLSRREEKVSGTFCIDMEAIWR